MFPYVVADLGAPPPINLHAPPLALTGIIGASHVFDYVTVYAIGGDGLPYGRVFWNGVWAQWACIGLPVIQQWSVAPGTTLTGVPTFTPSANASANAVISNGQNVWVYAVDTVGSLWGGIWGPSQTAWVWERVWAGPLGFAKRATPTVPASTSTIASILGASITANGQQVTVTTTDGTLVVFIFNSGNPPAQPASWVYHVFPPGSQPVLAPPVAVLGWDHCSTDTNWRNWALNTVLSVVSSEAEVPLAVGVLETVPGISDYTSLPVEITTFGWINILFWTQNGHVYCGTMGGAASS